MHTPEEILNRLEALGPLSLSKFVTVLRDEFPHAYISYPTLRKAVAAGKIKVVQRNLQSKIMPEEAWRWVVEGMSLKPTRYSTDFNTTSWID